jgi:RNA polymerase sigma factor (sigma-70 family)
MAASQGPDDHAQLEALVRRYSEFIRRLVAKVGGWRADAVADDVEQAVFLGIWRQIEQQRHVRHPTSYIYKAAVRETLRLLRERRMESLEEIAPDTEPFTADGPEHAFEAKRKIDALEECLGSLRSDREIAVRAHLAGFSVEEIMNLRGWSYQKARNLIARGIADLRHALRQRGIHG